MKIITEARIVAVSIDPEPNAWGETIETSPGKEPSDE